MGVSAASAAAIAGSQPDRFSTAAPDKAAVLQELGTILDSPAFRHSSRSKQFLSFVVQHTLDCRHELLKERTIGAELFDRKADYSTGDDPIVRVQAGEVRRRLEQHYKIPGTGSAVRIELPVGSYVPEFHFRSSELQVDAKPELVPERSKKPRILLWATLALCVVVPAVLVAVRVVRSAPQLSALDQFWAPVFSTQRPVLVCLAKPVFYRPSLDLFHKYSKTHPGTFQSEVERLNQDLPLDPNEKIPWRDMVVFTDFGVASGDVYAAFRISSLLTRINKENQLRIGSESSFDEFRSSPAVMVGAFSNRWTLEMTSNLRFTFAEKDEVLWIQDRNIADKQWFAKRGPHGDIAEDYGIATRLLDSKTGQLVIAVAGITAPGSDAAAQFISNQNFLAEGLRSAPADWKKKNMQFVVKTQVVDSVAGPPQVVASYFW